MNSQDSQLQPHDHDHSQTLHDQQAQFQHPHDHSQTLHDQQAQFQHQQGMVVSPQQHSSHAAIPNQVFTYSSIMIHQQQQQFQPQSQQNPGFLFNSMFHPGPGLGTASAAMDCPPGFRIETLSKKRGRPRKYSPRKYSPVSPTPVNPISSSIAGQTDSGVSATPLSEKQTKKARGRPPGSTKKQLDALGSVGSAGVGFTPHVIMVELGEDIASKMMEFSQQGPRTVCILSAIGAVCNVTLCPPSNGGDTVSLEGEFEIISLSGSFFFSESDGHRSSGLSVSLAGADGKVVGGCVAGTLKAASQVQLIVGSFIAGTKKLK